MPRQRKADPNHEPQKRERLSIVLSPGNTARVKALATVFGVTQAKVLEDLGELLLPVISAGLTDTLPAQYQAAQAARLRDMVRGADPGQAADAGTPEAANVVTGCFPSVRTAADEPEN